MIRKPKQPGCNQRVKSWRMVVLWMLKRGFVLAKQTKVSQTSAAALEGVWIITFKNNLNWAVKVVLTWWHFCNWAAVTMRHKWSSFPLMKCSEILWNCVWFFCFAWVEECFSSSPSPTKCTNNNHPLWERDERTDTLPWSISIKQSACQGRGLYVFEGSKEADRWVYGFTVEVGPPLLSGTPTHPGKHTNTLAFPSRPETWGGGGRRGGEDLCVTTAETYLSLQQA